MLPIKEHVLGELIAVSPTPRNVGDPHAPSLHLQEANVRRCVPITPLEPANSEKTAETNTVAVLVVHPPKREKRGREKGGDVNAVCILVCATHQKEPNRTPELITDPLNFQSK